MAFEIVMYVVAVSLPVWLVAAQVNPWRRAVKPPQGQVESATVPGATASSVATRPLGHERRAVL
jgi:hypothetical protein